MKNSIIESFVAGLLVLVALLLLNPLHFWMPDMMLMGMLAALFVLFALFASFLLREKSLDERDAQHRALSGRNAFLVGSGLLIVGIVVQGFAHAIDSWLVSVLVVMILVKLGTRFWSDRNR